MIQAKVIQVSRNWLLQTYKIFVENYKLITLTILVALALKLIQNCSNGCSSLKFRINFKWSRGYSLFLFLRFHRVFVVVKRALNRWKERMKRKEKSFRSIWKIELLTLNSSGVRPVSPVFPIPGLWMPLPVFIPDHSGPSASGYSLQTLKSLKSLKIRAQGSSF